LVICGWVYVWYSSSFLIEGIIFYNQCKKSIDIIRSIDAKFTNVEKLFNCSSIVNSTESLYVHHMHGGQCTKYSKLTHPIPLQMTVTQWNCPSVSWDNNHSFYSNKKTCFTISMGSWVRNNACKKMNMLSFWRKRPWPLPESRDLDIQSFWKLLKSIQHLRKS